MGRVHVLQQEVRADKVVIHRVRDSQIAERDGIENATAGAIHVGRAGRAVVRVCSKATARVRVRGDAGVEHKGYAHGGTGGIGQHEGTSDEISAQVVPVMALTVRARRVGTAVAVVVAKVEQHGLVHRRRWDEGVRRQVHDRQAVQYAFELNATSRRDAVRSPEGQVHYAVRLRRDPAQYGQPVLIVVYSTTDIERDRCDNRRKRTITQRVDRGFTRRILH